MSDETNEVPYQAKKTRHRSQRRAKSIASTTGNPEIVVAYIILGLLVLSASFFIGYVTGQNKVLLGQKQM